MGKEGGLLFKRCFWCAILSSLVIFTMGCVHTKSRQNDLLTVNPENINPIITDSTSFGRITGVVLDVETQNPLPGAVILITGTNKGTNTKMDGTFIISHLPIGVYTLEARMFGYEFKKINKVNVLSQHTTTINFKLKPTIVEVEYGW